MEGCWNSNKSFNTSVLKTISKEFLLVALNHFFPFGNEKSFIVLLLLFLLSNVKYVFWQEPTKLVFKLGNRLLRHFIHILKSLQMALTD